MRHTLLVGLCVLGLSALTRGQDYAAGRHLLCAQNVHYGLSDIPLAVYWGDEKSRPVAVDWPSWNKLQTSIAAGDREGYQALRTDKKIIDLQCGTYVQIIQYENGVNHLVRGYQARVKEGPHNGKLVYIPETSLMDSPRGMDLPDDISKRMSAIKEFLVRAEKKAVDDAQNYLAKRLVDLHTSVMKRRAPRGTKKAQLKKMQANAISEGISEICEDMKTKYGLTNDRFSTIVAINVKSEWAFVKDEKDKKSILELFKLIGLPPAENTKKQPKSRAELERERHERKSQDGKIENNQPS
jgi:hypothetical protein